MRKLFAILGNPVAHSKSPLMHNMAFGTFGIKACYGRYLLEDGDRLRGAFLSLGLSGANITVPHKEAAYRACDILDPFAKKVKAVNTIMHKDGKLHGYNTDAPGFLKTVESFGKELKILFLGAGGTAQSSAEILKETGHRVTILNRSRGRLAYFTQNGFPAFTWDGFAPAPYDIVVNMTSAGLGDDSLPAPAGLLEKILPDAKAAIDVIYGRKTPFIRMAEKAGIPAADGTEMLLYQGVIAFGIFTGNRYPPEEAEKAMRRALLL
jgi:shikimate dehydrogenase